MLGKWANVRVGDPVELYSAFTGSWVGGFEVAEEADGGFVVRRVSDGHLLPPTSYADLRPVGATPAPATGGRAGPHCAAVELRPDESAIAAGRRFVAGQLEEWRIAGAGVEEAAGELLTGAVARATGPLVLSVAQVGGTVCLELHEPAGAADPGSAGVVVVDAVQGRWDVRSAPPEP